MRIKPQNPRKGLNIVIRFYSRWWGTHMHKRTHAVRASPLLQVLLLCEQGREKKDQLVNKYHIAFCFPKHPLMYWLTTLP